MTGPGAEMRTPAEPSGARLVGTLAAAGLLSGLAIVTVHELTLPIIERNNARAIERAVLEVVPGSTRMQGLVLRDGVVRAAVAGERAEVFAAYDDAGVFAGYAIPAEGAGFQDVIRLIYGFVPSRGEIVGMSVLESRETPGLGDKIYKDGAFVGQFGALAVEPGIVCVKHGTRSAAHEVDAITGATISAKAVVRIIAEANGRWIGVLPVEGVFGEEMGGGFVPRGEEWERRAGSPSHEKGEGFDQRAGSPSHEGGGG